MKAQMQKMHDQMGAMIGNMQTIMGGGMMGGGMMGGGMNRPWVRAANWRVGSHRSERRPAPIW
jgi:hypothetical protein